MRARITRGVRAGMAGIAGAMIIAWIAASGRLCAQPCTPGGTTWRIYNELERRSTMDTQNGRTTSRTTMTGNGSQHSDTGQDVTDSFTNHSDDNGARESERLCFNGTLVNPLKSTCWSDDGSVSTLSRDWDRDAAGNTVQRVTETTVTKAGDRTTTTVEKTCDSQGNCRTKGPETRRDRTSPPDPRACDTPYWTGSMTGTVFNDDSRADDADGGATSGNPYAVRTHSASDTKVRDVTRAVLVAPDVLHPGSKNAIVSRLVNNRTTGLQTSAWKVRCDGQDHAVQADTNQLVQEQGSASGRSNAGVGVSGTAYSISFSSPDVEVTTTTTGSSVKTAPRCFGGSSSVTASPLETRGRQSGRLFEGTGLVDPAHPDTLVGQRTIGNKAGEKVEWNLTRFDPARNRK